MSRVMVAGDRPAWVRELIGEGVFEPVGANPDILLLCGRPEDSFEVVEKCRSRSALIVALKDPGGSGDIVVLPDDQSLARQSFLRLMQMQRFERGRNPLTGLPGNPAIKSQIENYVLGRTGYALCYIDMNNFKNYNDRYGFDAGDRLIAHLADILVEGSAGNFVGHVGGDDFIMVIRGESRELVESVCREFDRSLDKFYPDEDYRRQSFTGEDRQGNEREFGLVRIAVAVLADKYQNLRDLGYAAAILKEIAKERSKAGGRSLWLSDAQAGIWNRDRLKRLTGNENRTLKRSVIELLGEIAADKDHDLFLHLLRDDDPLVRKSAAYALGRIAKPAALEALLGAMSDSSPHVRMRAAEALGYYRDRRAETVLIRALDDPNFYVRAAAVGSVGRRKSTAAIPALCRLRDTRLMPAAIASLGEIGSAEALPFLDRQRRAGGHIKPVIEAIGKINDRRSVEMLFDLLDEPAGRTEVLKAICELCRNPSLVPEIARRKDKIGAALEGPQPFYAIMILYRIGDASAQPEIKRYLRDERDYVRRAAVLYFGNSCRNLGAIGAIALADRSPYVRTAAVDVLARFGSKSLVYLRRLLKDPEHRVRKSAARAMLQLLFQPQKS